MKRKVENAMNRWLNSKAACYHIFSASSIANISGRRRPIPLPDERHSRAFNGLHGVNKRRNLKRLKTSGFLASSYLRLCQPNQAQKTEVERQALCKDESYCGRNVVRKGHLRPWKGHEIVSILARCAYYTTSIFLNDIITFSSSRWPCCWL